jgi:putative Ca2+/H+ antiporter (TMEM165/GDT1 family)
MNIGILFITFALVIPAELPDKTFITCIMMASRHRPLPVWLGGASALVLQAGIAVIAGRLLELLPKTAVRSVIAAVFMLGALYLLVAPEEGQEKNAEKRALAEKSGDRLPDRSWKVALLTFSIVALAEFGDITQVLIANLTARYHAPLAVFIGASAGFILVSAAGVIGGRALIRVVPLQFVRRLSGCAMLGLGIYSVVGLV